MKQLLVVDLVCPKPYVLSTLDTTALGGTEATVIRTLRELRHHYTITCLQRGRTVTESEDGITFQPEASTYPKPHIVISLRDTYTHKRFRIKYPDARHILWLHDLCTREMFEALDSHSTVVCVSDYHRGQFRELLMQHASYNKIEAIDSHTIYNPLEPTLPQPGAYDKHKLVFFSSPHKGLGDTLKTFKLLHAYDSNFKLYVANPGYMPSYTTLPDGVTNLGVLTHSDVIEHVRSSLAVFSMNRVFPETMGLVYAEANAVGTPVLTHPIGAAREILSHPYELIDTRNAAAVIERIVAWSEGSRPIVRARPEFRITATIKQWRRLLDVSITKQ